MGSGSRGGNGGLTSSGERVRKDKQSKNPSKKGGGKGGGFPGGFPNGFPGGLPGLPHLSGKGSSGSGSNQVKPVVAGSPNAKKLGGVKNIKARKVKIVKAPRTPKLQ